jgi:plasmid segregation protein ParM
MAVIRAIEVGFGTTSLTTGNDNIGNPVIKTFPSFVAKADPTKTGLSAGLNKRDTVIVDVNGQKYEVGPDAQLASDKVSSRVLNSNYIKSDQYQALLFGSLSYMNADKIDLLVLALPVESWSRRDELKSLIIGSHNVNGKNYFIRNVWVIVQPMGGLMAYANRIGQDGFNELKEQTILSVDPGFGTFDYVLSRGLKLNESRSGGNELGMSAILSDCAKVLRVAFPALNEFPVEKIDEAFYLNDGFIRISGKRYPFPLCNGKTTDGKKVDVSFDLTPTIDNVAGNAVTKLKNTVGNGGDIDLILLMGGPNKVYMKSLSEAYPDHDIVVLDDPLRSVCEGMYFAGLQYDKALTKLSKTA